MSCGVDRRCSLDPTLLWLWCRPAAVALIQPLVWELPYAVSVALKTKNVKGLGQCLGHGDTSLHVSLIAALEGQLDIIRNLLMIRWSGTRLQSVDCPSRPGALAIGCLRVSLKLIYGSNVVF